MTATQNLGGGGTGITNSGTLGFSNTIVAGNRDWRDAASDCSGTLISQGYSLVGSTEGCAITGTLTADISGVTPRLGPLQNNGGPTPTHALLSGSPAINAGNPATPGSPYPACPNKDQRLKPRGATRCDIGGFEVQ